MAEKIVNGIGREIRYVEYKLRKKSGSKKKTQRSREHNSSSATSTPYSDEFNSTHVSPEIKNAIPKDKSEESIQIQIAMAMSKEDDEERKKKEISDKLRLEMAISQSLTKAEEQKQKSKPAEQTQATLLELSSSNVSINTNTENIDPWTGKPIPTTVVSASGLQSQSVSNNTDIWGTQSRTVNQDPWNSGLNQQLTTTNTNDPWGEMNQNSWNTSTAAFSTSSNAESSAPALTDAWGGLIQQNSVLLQSGTTPQTTLQNTQPLDLFGTDIDKSTTQPEFDPLQDFDNLRINNNNQGITDAQNLTPVVLSSDTTTNVASDILPISLSSNNLDTNGNITNKTQSLLDGTGGLVNLENLMSAPGKSNPYYNKNTKSLSGTSAFAPTAAQPSMNQLRGQQGNVQFTQPQTTMSSSMYPNVQPLPNMYGQSIMNPFLTPQTNNTMAFNNGSSNSVQNNVGSLF